MSDVVKLYDAIDGRRVDFPLLKQTMRGKPLVYLDTAASAQKPQQVIDAVANFYQHDNANVHRGLYELGERATAAYESTRQTLKQFINAQHNHEIILTAGTTAAINLVAQSFGRTFIQSGDEIIISGMEHHSNIVPWQMLCEQTGAQLKIIPVLEDGSLDLDAYTKMLSKKVKLVSVVHVSNVLGTINPVKDMIAMAHTLDIPVLLDGAQAAPHMPVDMHDLDCDFFVFSAQKMYGPTGVGVLYGKEKWLEQMPPYQGGGEMIRRVSFEKTEYNVLPYKFEAGTPNIAGVVGFDAALRYLLDAGLPAIVEHEKSLTDYALKQLQTVSGLKLIGEAASRKGVISFVMDQAHPHDIATILDNEGVALRAGHHCAMPLMERFKVPATVRASFGLYNNKSDIDALIVALRKVEELFPNE